MKKLIAALAAALFAGGANAQQGTIKFLVGFPAGASLDTMTRLVADKMQASLGQNVIVENRTGAAGQIAMTALKNSPADGSVLVMTPLVAVVTAPHIQKLPYDPFKDFAPVAHAANFLFAFAMGPGTPAKTLKEYVALVKKDKKYGYYASAAVGSIPHFLGVLFGRTAGIELTHVPYKGTANVLQALAGGEIYAASTVNADINRLVQAGKARLLAVAGAKRDPAYPDVPTFKEAGYDMPAATPSWYALFAPAGVPDATAARLSKAAIAAIRNPDLNKRLSVMGLQPTGHGPDQLARIMRTDYENWGQVIKASGFKPQ